MFGIQPVILEALHLVIRPLLFSYTRALPYCEKAGGRGFDVNFALMIKVAIDKGIGSRHSQ